MKIVHAILILTVIVPVAVSQKSRFLAKPKIRSGEWELNILFPVQNGKRKHITKQNCVSADEAASFSIRALLDDRRGISAEREYAEIGNGHIEGRGTVSTSDGNIRNRPIRLVGTYDFESFDISETLSTFGHDIVQDYSGRYVGPCETST